MKKNNNTSIVANTDNISNNNETPATENTNANNDTARPRANYWSMAKGFAIRLVVIYLVTSFFKRGGTPPATKNGSPSTSYSASNPSSAPILPSQNIFFPGTLFDLSVYITENNTSQPSEVSSHLVWSLKGLSYSDWIGGSFGDGSYQKKIVFKASQQLMNNGSLYIHAYFMKSGSSYDPHDVRNSFFLSTELTRYKSRKISNTVNLLTGITEGPKLSDEEKKMGVLSTSNNKSKTQTLPPTTHWHPNMTINLLDDQTAWTMGSVPAPLNAFIKFSPSTNEYYPVIYFNKYWNLNEEYMPVNETTPFLNFTLTFAPISLFRFQLYLSQSMRNNWYANIFGEGVMEQSDDEEDKLKKTLLETNPYLLGMTVAVTLLHTFFEILAFKNDIQFWKSRKTLEGLSVRSVVFNVFQQLIVVLYVLDNDTNFVVKVSVAIGLLIEFWKIHKVMNVSIDRSRPFFGFIPRIKFEDRSSYVESETKVYDQLAFKYLSWLLFPLLACYSVYSLIYEEHRGWYSWILSLFYGFLLTFGFIMMTPQLFINYKMKSVAHLPWRMMTYKALNTFIDDIFAFVIRMPTLYRLGCLRDDVVFFIFLYQRWVYPIDPQRVNEFGLSQEMMMGQNTEAAPLEEKKEEGEKEESKKDQ